MSKKPNEVIETTIPPVYRTLFVGLGGTGGEVLYKMLERMEALPAEERARAHMIYIDTDKRDTDKLSAMGVPAVNIGSSDTVRDMIRYLGQDDGVLDWIAADRNDNAFLSSKTDDGASQFRLKSRLCLAKFLMNPNNELKQMVDTVSIPGNQLVNETLRVYIVSSVAGGTGAGTFVQVALYLRECFRQRGHNDISITGLFACPDLFAKTTFSGPGDIENVENMYSNAYAAVRELNAMNLVVDSQNNDTDQGYGNSIHIAIDTESEGLLFDSKNPLFSANSNYKPYNQMYFVDISNTSGGVLRTMDQYFGVMADIVYTRMFTSLEAPLRSDESNELGIHQSYPTAIYGSAGYGKIIYPYDGIIEYLALRKTHDELDYTWTLLENEWDKYKRNQRMMARESGRRWAPNTTERGARYISDLNDAMKRSGSRLRELLVMIKDPDSSGDRAAQFLAHLDESLSSAIGLEENPTALDHPYGIGQDPLAAEARQQMSALYEEAVSKSAHLKDTDQIIALLRAFSGSAEAQMESYMSALTANVSGRAHYVSGVVAPQTEQDGLVADREKDPLNLFHGLLSLDGAAVHPVAARYLLYSLREKMRARLASNKDNTPNVAMLTACQDLRLALDSNPSDDKDITVTVRIKEIEKTFFLTREGEARKALRKYLKKFEDTMLNMMTLATENLICEVYTRILKVVDVLIEQYEGLFDNLEQYQTELRLQVMRERDRHETASDDRCIFINASREAKEYTYVADTQTRDVLDSSSDEIAAAAGAGVYQAMMARTWKRLEEMEQTQLTDGFIEESEDTFSDLGGVFDNIVSIYKSYLQKKATHLKAGVIRALIRECCRSVGVAEKDLSDPILCTRVRNLFEDIVLDMLNKAEPMLNYDNANTDPYFVEEKDDAAVAVSKLYMHIGMHPDAGEALKLLYQGTETSDVIAAFDNVFHPVRGSTVHVHFSPYELVCFKAVHCLQPTQIRKFREDYHQGFYHYYKKRLAKMNATQAFSFTPHLDKRWHLREAMPYISHDMDIAWHHKTARAFVYEALVHNLCFTVDGDGVTCFNYTRKGQEQGTYVRWPEKRLVTVNDISRLLEYLQEQDERIEVINLQMDDLIADLLEKVSKHTDSMPIYKATLTSNATLRDLRSNLLVRKHNVSTLTAVRDKKGMSAPAMSEEELTALKKVCADLGIEEADVLDVKKTLGGLLEIAWMVHRSEEKQGRDHDFGECIVACVRDIIEQLCQQMCGVRVNPESDLYAEYQDLYNSIVEKFMESYVLSVLRKLHMLDDALLKDMPHSVFYRYLKVPEVVLKTADYTWAANLLQLK